jgi:hypothetical protein
LNNLQRRCLIIGAASFNSLGLIKSGPAKWVIRIRTLKQDRQHIGQKKKGQTAIYNVLKVKNPTKVSGPDLINPRLLKEAAPIIFWIKSLLDLSLVFLTKHVTSFQIFLNLFQCMGFLKCFAFL